MLEQDGVPSNFCKTIHMDNDMKKTGTIRKVCRRRYQYIPRSQTCSSTMPCPLTLAVLALLLVLVPVFVLLLIVLVSHAALVSVNHVALHGVQGTELLRIGVVSTCVQRDTAILQLAALRQ